MTKRRRIFTPEFKREATSLDAGLPTKRLRSILLMAFFVRKYEGKAVLIEFRALPP
jgi:hypothetical protein